MNVASLFATLGIDTSGFQKGMGGAKGSLEGFGKSILGQVVGITSLATAVAMAGKFAASSVTDWADYADSMRLSAQMAGVTTVEMSKLVQAGDDFRVPIETMQKSMELALKNGFVPTIENLAILSDELLAIEDPALRAEAASKIFGKSYADMMPFLLAGGDAIRGATDAISDNLIVTKEGAASAKEYKDQLDELGDSWTGLKNDLGKALVPAATEGINTLIDVLDNVDRVKSFKELNDGLKETGINTSSLTSSYQTLAGKIFGVVDVDESLITSMTDVTKWADVTTKSFRQQGYDAESAQLATAHLFDTYGIGVVVTSKWSDANDRAYNSLTDVAEASGQANVFMYESVAASAASAAATKQAAAEWDAYVVAVGNITSLTANFSGIIGLAKTYDGILGDIAANAEERDRLMAAGFSETSEEVKALDDSTLALQGTMTDLANQMTLDMLQATIAIDGVTEAEMGAYFDMAIGMGLMSENAKDAAIGAFRTAKDTIDGMTLDEKTLVVKTIVDTSGVDGWEPDDKWATVHYGTSVAPKAAGGPVSGGAPYLVGERGPELFVPEGRGNIIPNGRTNDLLNSGGNTVNNYYTLTMPTSSSPADIRTAFELMEVWA